MVIGTPLPDRRAGTVWCLKSVLIEAFIPEFPVEALDVDTFRVGFPASINFN